MPNEPPYLGACWVAVIGGAIFFLYHWLRGNQPVLRDRMNWLTWGCIVIGLSIAPVIGILPKFMPVYGYGAMFLIGFVTAIWFSSARAKAVGLDPLIVVDGSLWIMLFGVAGGRLAYLVQYGDHVFAKADTLPKFLFAAVNLSQGGLVQIGGLVGGTLGFLLFCRRRKVDFFEFADLMTPAIFIGIGFGRLGCLLNGCCYGDSCNLPWAIQFPAGSVTFGELVFRGFVDPKADWTIPLHPTQIYSSINGFILALVTGTYYWYRRNPGDVFAIGCILYAITRVQIEFLRADEMGQLGTGFTISQFYSLGIFLLGIGILSTGHLRAKKRAEKNLKAN